MTSPERVLAAINKLLSPFPAGSTQGTAEEVLRRYIEVASGFDVGLVEDAVGLLMNGEVPSYDGRFAPTPPQLASACRKAAHNRSHGRYLESFSAPRLPAPEIVKTPEQLERAKAKIDEFVASQGPSVAEQHVNERDRAERLARHDDFFADDFVPTGGGVGRISRTLAKKLGYEVGSPESDDAAA